MTKTSTIQFKVNSLASSMRGDLTDLRSAFDFEEEFSDVFSCLGTADQDVDQLVVDKIMALAEEP